MGYSKYKKIKQLKDAFGCQFLSVALFEKAQIQPKAPSEWLLMSLDYAYSTPPTNEKSKSERLVSPVLLEISHVYKSQISFFSGEEINIDAKQNLAGPCDFFFAFSPPSLLLTAPIISIAEAKDEDLEWGIAQCAAQLYAANLFNIADKKDIQMLYGCATTGVEWHFMCYDTQKNTFFMDSKPITDLSIALGVWHYILQLFTKGAEA
jgi:hypothetical protein